MAKKGPKVPAKPAQEAVADVAIVLDKKVKTMGTFFNWRGKQFPAYVIWDDEARAFNVKCAESDRAFTEVAFKDVRELREHNLRFVPNGETAELVVAESEA